jgi:hypothetical protein
MTKKQHAASREHTSGCIKIEPIAVRIHIEANKGTPAIAGMIADILTAAGATVTASDKRVGLGLSHRDIRGLKVHIDRLTWVRDEEAARWEKQ